jgi:tetratricopeptide (TPR) repeat protein
MDFPFSSRWTQICHPAPRHGRGAAGTAWTLAAATGLLAGWLVPMSALAQVSEAQCGPVWGTRHHGPFDYRKASQYERLNVENFHFTASVEKLTSGKTNAAPGPDINYTLRAFPNHHRALNAVTRLGDRDRKDQPEGLEWPVECYFERALRFVKDDIVVHSLYAHWLVQRKRMQDAEQQLKQSLALAGDNPLSHFSIGLIYFEMGLFDKASAQARLAQTLGWARTDLIDKLKAAGQWREAPAAAGSIAAEAAASPGGPSAATPPSRGGPP